MRQRAEGKASPLYPPTRPDSSGGGAAGPRYRAGRLYGDLKAGLQPRPREGEGRGKGTIAVLRKRSGGARTKGGTEAPTIDRGACYPLSWQAVDRDGGTIRDGDAMTPRWGSDGIMRSIDFVAAVAGLILLLPFMLITAVLIKATSPGPALFVQPRIGRHERPFNCLKFRTMAVGAPVAGTHEVPAAHVTPLGRSLRRLKIDELPQLINVALGEMSLVGPRPCLPSQTELIGERRIRGVFDIRPGVTGPAQVRGVDMSTPAALAELDKTWAESPTLSKYLTYVLQTAAGRGGGDRIRD